MNSQDLILSTGSLSLASSLFLSNKETQTSKINTANSFAITKSASRPVLKNIEAKNDNKKIFERCEIIRDPNDPELVSIIKETFVEEVIIDCDSIFGNPMQNKYQYCKEVTQPYTDTYPKNCPYYPKNIPKRQPCNTPPAPGCPEVKPPRKPCGIDTMSSDPCKSTFENPTNVKKNPSSSCSSINKKAKKPSQNVSDVVEQVEDCSLKSCFSKCVKEGINIAKKGSACCIDNFEKVIGTKRTKCDDKPTYYVMEKPKKEPDSCHVTPKSSVQVFFENQSQTIATISCAIKGFLGTVYTKTKDAVHMIRSESCGRLQQDSQTSNQSKTKDCSNTSSNNSLIENLKDPKKNEDNQSQSFLDTAREEVNQMISKVASRVSSTISILQNSSFDQIVEDILDRKLDGSPYDDPDISRNPPKPVSQDHDPAANSSVFALLKKKFLSMFDSKDSCKSDDDDDENSAEKIFEKYCDQ